jgi:large repetitive protein
MSKSRRSLVRSTLFNIRQLWQRRQEARKEVRRSLLGTTFEQLEPRLAMAITTPLPGASDHIHPILQLYVEGQQIVIPTNVGITSSQTFHPHTHDLTGTIHIGEGNVGDPPSIRNTTLKDFFDIWASATASTTASRNVNALLETDLTDGTNQPRFMDRTVNPSTHVLRMYVKEVGDANFELEYASNQTTNGVARPELYVPRGVVGGAGDQIIITLDKIAQAVNGPSFQPIGNQTVLGGAPTWLGIDGFDPNGGVLTYTVEVVNSSSPNLLTATVTPSTNKTLVLDVENYGQMRFQLFNDLAPRTVQHITTLVENGEFDTLAKFYRISRTDEAQRIARNADGNTIFSFNGVAAPTINLTASTTAAQIQAALRSIPTLEGIVVSGNAGGPFTVTFSGQLAGTDVPLLTVNNGNASVTALAAANDFVIQGGPADTSSTLGNFDDEFHVDLQFTGPGLLAMAKSTDDTNDAQVFVTGDSARFLDMNHSIFGVLTDGDEVRRAIQHTGPSGDGAPPSEIKITNAQIITDTENGALKLKAAPGASGSATVRVTVSDGTQQFTQDFNVTVTPDSENPAPFLDPVAPVTGAANQPITIQLTAKDVQNAEVQQITRNANGSTTFSFNGVNATPITFTFTPASGSTPATGTTAAQVKAALETIPALNGNITVSGAPGGPYFVSFIGALANTNVATIAVNNTNASVQNVSPLFFDATKPNGETVAYTLDVNHDTGLVTITPPANFQGSFQVSVGVRGTADRSTQDEFDAQLVTVNVAAGAPTVDLVATSDSGTSSTDNITNASTLEFLVTGVTSGATVQLFEGDTVLATGTVGASANSITLTVSNPGVNLGQGQSGITAKQTVNSQVGPTSTVLNVTYDSTAPVFNSAAPTIAPIGFDLAYNAQTNEEGSGVVYTLSNPPTGATINSSTGVVTFTPTSAQEGTQTFGVVATDAAGNPATQALTLAVQTAKIDMTVTLTKPDGSPLTQLTANEEFVLHVFAEDVRTPARGVFSAYLDVIFDSTKATVTGPIQFDPFYSAGRQGSTATAGLIDEAGAFAGFTEAGAGPRKLFSVPMRATASGTLTFALDPNDSGNLEMLVYGLEDNDPVADTEVHFGSATITVGATFNAVNDAFSVGENTQNNTIDPLANDASIGGATNTLTISAVGTTSNGGTVTITQNGTRLSYTPAANFRGTETFTYTARNQNGDTQVGTVTMTVDNTNDPPVAVNDTFGVGRNSSGNVLNVLANDTTPDAGETLRVTAVGTGSKGGTITITNNGANITYTPANGASGTETFTYTISDAATGGLTATATVTVNISNLTANPDSTTVAEDSTATTIDVLANDTLDTQVGGTKTITNVGTTSNGGTVSITENGTRISYTPAANFQGTETFTYTLGDGQGNSATNTVTVTVTNVNDPPVATNDTLTAFKNTTTTFDVLANDTSGVDPSENLIIDAVTQPTTGGTVSIIENGKKISFVPTSGFSGTTTFTYTIKDPSGATAVATATVTVNDFTPSSLAGFVFFDVNNNGIKDAGEAAMTGVTITLTGTATAGSQTNVNQTVKTGDDGSYKFESLAPGNYTIRQTQPLFTIDGIDTAGSLGGTVSNNQIVISSLAQGATGTNYNFGELGRAAATISLRDFFSSTSRNYAHAAFDSAGNALWHTTNGSAWNGHTATTFALVNNKSVIRTQSTNGGAQLMAKSQSTSKLPVRQSGANGGNVLYYVPGGPGTTPATNNATPVSVADSYSTPVNTALTVTAANGVLKNDTDAENNSLTAFVVTPPANGTLSLNGNGGFTFTPTTGFTGTTSFTYRASDGNSDSEATTVTISVGTNGVPVGVADSFTATEDTTLTINAANGLLKNDTDPENNTLTAAINTQPTKGTISLASDGSFVYTPSANANGTDTFTYRATDTSSNQSAITTVTITIAPVNDAPSVSNDNFTTTRNTVLNQAAPGVLVNDVDVDGTTLQVSVVSTTTKGTLSLASDGSFVYTPNNNVTGTDTFTYRATDGSLTADGVVTITINPPQNQAPVANADTFTTNEDSPLSVTTNGGVLGNDTDPENDPRTAELVTNVTHGSLTLNSDGTFSYTPAANFNGTDFFTYRAKDATGSSTPATVTITVNSLNDLPVANADTYETDPGEALTVAIGDGVLKNDTDADGTTGLTVEVVNDVDNGTLTLNPNGSFTYTPNSGFSGNDTFTYKVKDTSTGESTPATVTIKVQAAPQAVADGYSVNEDVQLVISSTSQGLLGNDTDANQDPLEAIVVVQPANGTLSLNDDGTFTYQPNANFSGTDTFTYKANDGDADSNVATVTITVNAVNDAPVRTAGNPAEIRVDADSANTTAVTLGLSALTYGPGGGADETSQTFTFKITAIPTFMEVYKENGTTKVNVNDVVTLDELKALKYKTLAGATGTGSITWTVQDSGGTTNGGVDTLTETLAVIIGDVNEAPVRTAGSLVAINVNEDSANTTAAGLGLSGLTYGPGGGSEEAGQTLAYKITSIPAFLEVFKANGNEVLANETITLDELRALTYKTLANASGTGGLIISVQDSGGTTGGGVDTLNETLSITVSEINDAPARTAGSPPAISINEDSANTEAVTLGLADLTYGPGGGSAETDQTLTYKITAIPAFLEVYKENGTTKVNVNDALTLAELKTLKYKTLANANGGGSILWTVQDSGGTASGGVDTLTETLSITVNSVNDAPARTAGNPGEIRVAADSANTTAVSLGLAALDYGPGGGTTESQTLTFKITSIPSFVTLVKGSGAPVTVDTVLTLAELRGLLYKTVAGASGAGSITWTVQDNGGTANGGVDTLTETLAIIVGDVNEAPVRTGGSLVALSVNEDSANAAAVTLGLSGLTYGPGGGGEESTQTFTYTITSIPAFVELFKEDGTTEVEAGGTVLAAELQTLKYKTLANASGTGNITFTVKDSGGTANGGVDTLTQTLGITVNEINDAPARTAGSPADITVSEDSATTAAVTLNLAGLTYGPGGGTAEVDQTFTYEITAIPEFIELYKEDGTTEVEVNATVTLDELKALKYKTLANASGTGSITWTVKDSGGTANGGLDTLTETLGITVGAVNDAPARTAGDPADISVNEDDANTTAVPLGLSALAYGPGGGTDEVDQELTFTITAIPAFIEVFKADGTTEVNVDQVVTLDELKTLTYKTVEDGHGSATLTWTVKDDGGVANGGVDTLTQVLGITVIEVNDAPSFTLAGDPPTIEDDAGPQTETAFVTNIEVGPENESGQTPSFAVTLTTSTGTLDFDVDPAIAPDGTLTYTITAGTSGTATFSVVLTDNGSNTPPSVNASAAQSFTITVDPSEGEGEAAGFANAAMLDAFYASLNDADPASANSDELATVAEDEWQDAVDAAMGQLG